MGKVIGSLLKVIIALNVYKIDQNKKMPINGQIQGGNKMSKKINKYNTKNEILAAYNELLEKVNVVSQQQLDPVREMEEKRELATIEKVDTAVQNDICASLNALINNIQDAETTYSSITEAIDIKKKELKEMYDIEKAANTLVALINSQHKIKEDFDTVMEVKELESETKLKELSQKITELRAEYEKEVNEEEAELQKIRNRKEEEWKYDFERRKKIKEDNLNDDLQNRKKIFYSELEEKQAELNTRENIVKERENKCDEKDQLVTSLQSAVDAIPEKEAAIRSEVKDEVEKKLAKNNAIKENYLKKEFENKEEIYKNKIEILENLLRDKEVENKTLSNKLDEAYSKIQDMALKTVEGSKDSIMLSKLENMIDKKSTN